MAGLELGLLGPFGDHLFGVLPDAVFAPAELAAIPLLVDKPLLLPANSLYTTTTMAATIVGFALGEPVMQLLRQVLSPLGSPMANLPWCLWPTGSPP